MVLYAADGIISAKTFRLRTVFPKALHGVPPGFLSQNKEENIMPEPSLQQLIQQLQAQASEKHRALLDALRNFDTQTANFRQIRSRRKLPLVTAQDKTRLMELHKAIGSAAEEVLKEKGESKELKDIVKRITALSSGSYPALLQYDPAKEPKTLSSLEEEVRTLTIHQGSVLLGGAETLGGAQSERVPLSFLDGKGNRISGVFSKKKCIEPKRQLAEAFQKMTGLPFFSLKPDSGNIRWLQNHFIEVIRKVPAFAQKLGRNAPDEDSLTAMMQECNITDKDGNNYIDPDRLKTCVELGLEESGQNIPAISEESWSQLARNFEPLISTLLFAHHTGKIPYGGRLDNRNAAMSAVADLLGMPSVVARAKPMRIIDKDGNVIEGTFMEAAKGMDPENLPPEAANIPRDALKNTDGKGFQDIANLQVLDYLCGNYDRHYANMFYQFDRNGKLIGVQGIDNDGAFGVIAKKELGRTGENYLHMTNLSNMKAMPKQTAERLMALDAVVKEADLVRMQAASQRLRDAAMTYLTGKMPGFTEEDADQPVQYPEGASDYTKRRIDVALDALRLGRQGVEIKPVELQTAQDNLRQAQAAQQRRMEEREPQLIQPAPETAWSEPFDQACLPDDREGRRSSSVSKPPNRPRICRHWIWNEQSLSCVWP